MPRNKRPPGKSGDVVSANIRTAREASGWSLERLADEAKIGFGTVYWHERGMRDARLSTLENLASALGVSTASLLSEAED